MVSKRVMKEFKVIEDASVCYNATLINDDIYHWQVSINDPDDSPQRISRLHAFRTLQQQRLKIFQ
jgi:ubiquitin-protein ligase